MIRTRSIFIALILAVAPLAGQMSNTLYFMDRIPQYNQLNPAFQPKCNVYVGMPGLSTVQFNIGNNSINMSDIWQYDKQSDSLLVFMANEKTKKAFISSLKAENSIFTNFQNDILAFGFRVNTWYFSFSTSVKADFRASYPKSFVEFLVNGIGIGESYEFKEFGINAIAYGEIALSASKIINEEYTVGGRVKFLAGLINISTDNKSLKLSTTEQDNIFVNSVSSDVTINMYAPILAETPDTGKIQFGDVFKTKDNIDVKDIKPFQSTGFATDLGVVYNGIEKLKLSASILDLGYISWKKNVYNYKMKSNYEFKGVEIDRDSIGNAFNNISDAILDSFKFTKTKTSYVTSLPTKFYVGAEYALQSYVSVGLLSLSQYYKSQYYQQIMVSANFRPLNMIMLSTSYSFFDNGFSNMGLGITFKLAPLQIYFMSDNIPLRVSKNMLPYKLEYFNFRFGLNWVFGCSDKKKMKDKPMGWE
jgi:hypothetical protein